MPALIILALLQFASDGSTPATQSENLNRKPSTIKTSERGLSITLRPVFNENKLNSRTLDISFQGESEIIGSPGEIALPAAVYTFGVPDGAVPRITGVSKSGGKTLKGIPARHPNSISRSTGVPVFFMDKSNINSNSIPKINLVTIKDVGYFRQQRIFQVIIHPYEVSASSDGINLFNEISVEISFGDVPSAKKSIQRISSAEEEIYSAAIVNFNQSKDWLVENKRYSPFNKTVSFGPGDWYKMTLLNDGIYKLTTDDLSSFGINLNNIDLNRLKIYSPYFGGRVMNGKIGAVVTDNLIEIPAWRQDNNSDGNFDSNDEVIFYGKGASGFEFNSLKNQIRFSQNPYSNLSFYWLNVAPTGSSPGKEMITTPSTAGIPDSDISQYEAFYHQEDEFINFLRTGTGFFGVSLTGISDFQEYPIMLNDVVSSQNSKFSMRTRSGIEDASFGGRFILSLDGTQLLSTSIVSNYRVNFRRKTVSNSPLKSGVNRFILAYEGVDSPSKGFLDWFEIRYTRLMKAESDILHFFTSSDSGLMKYNASGFSSNDVNIFNISNIGETYKISPATISSSSIIWQEQVNPGMRNEYYVSASSAYLSVSEITKVDGLGTPRARISGIQADYIIVTHKDFRESADQLADYRSFEAKPDDRLKTIVIDIDDIINEFSAGQIDPMALRYFFKHAYENWNAPKPSFALLFGDGDYDYRNITGESTNFILTYQLIDDTSTTTTHISFIDSRAADDHFAFISGTDRKADISLGRIVSRTPEDAANFVEKLILYESEPIFGNWKNTVTIVADDLFRPSKNPETNHIRDSEDKIVKTLPQSSDIRKIYMTEFKVETDAAVFGVRKPDATSALLEQLNRGTTFLIYIGHGGPTVLAQERLLTSERDLNIINTGQKLPIWVAGTCEFGRYDDPNIQSMAEDLLVQKQNGAIGMFAASRLVYSGPNATITAKFFNMLLPEQPFSSNAPRVGAALLATKLARSDDSNDQKYHYLGDPTMRVALPQGRATIESIDPPVLQALGKASIRGKILDKNGNILNLGSVSVAVNVFDSEKSVTRSETHNGVTGSISYKLPGPRIFSGPVSATAGSYESSFIVPRDISYGGNSGKTIIYWWDEASGLDGAGAIGNIEYDGTAAATADNLGPEISVGFQGLFFRPGDIVPQDALLEISLNDENGINLAEEVGHKITLTIDEDFNNKFNITQFFEYDIDSYQKGNISYPLPILDAGEHSLTVKAWDSYNNFTEESVVFNIATSDELSIERVYNYPNPMSTSTDFTYFLSQPVEEIEINIYTVAGRLIRKINDFSSVSIGFQKIRWDGRDEVGDRLANGVYIYRLRVKSSFTGQWVEVIEKLAIAR